MLNYSIKDLINRLFKYLKKYRFMFLFSLLIATVYVFSTLYAPYIVGNEIVGKFIDPKSFNIKYLYIPFIKLGILIVVAIISGIFMGRLLNICTFKIVKDIRIDAFNKILNLPVKYLDSNPHGELLTKITTDIDLIWDGLLHGFTHIFRGFVAILITMIFMFMSNWQLALIISLLTPLSMGATYFIAKFSHKSYLENHNLTGQMGGFINEMINEQKTVIAFDMQEENNKKYQKMDEDLFKVGVKAQFISSFSNPTTRLINNIIYLSVVVFGTILLVSNPTAMNIGLLTMFLSYAAQYARPFNEISNVTSEITSSFASLRRVLSLLDEKEIIHKNKEENINIKDPEFNFNNVSFSYDENRKILKDISFNVKKDTKVAIVGPTGCGKTTLINLIMRFYDLDMGEILINNRNIKDINRNSLRKNIGMVLQDSYVFKGSIKDNIKYSKEMATDEEIINAAKAANAHEFISKLKDGYDTIIDDSSLSSGENQLISIARLMLVVPNILILDEATSNIDTRTEINIQKAFNTLMKGKTSFVIAHRLSTIRNSDLILVMKDGKIVEKGNHESLIKLNGYYKELYFSNNQ